MVRSSARRVDTRSDWDCWAPALYTSPFEFNEQHHALRHACDYSTMNREMTAAVPKSRSPSNRNDDNDTSSWLDWPDRDLSD